MELTWSIRLRITKLLLFRGSLDLFHISVTEESNSTKKANLRIRQGQVVDGCELKQGQRTLVEVLKIEFFVGIRLVYTTAHEAGIIPLNERPNGQGSEYAIRFRSTCPVNRLNIHWVIVPPGHNRT